MNLKKRWARRIVSLGFSLSFLASMGQWNTLITQASGSTAEPQWVTAYSNDFNSADSLSNFDNYYSDDLTIAGDNGVLTNYHSCLQAWLLKDNALYKNDQGGDVYDDNHLISALTYTAKTFHDFRLDVDFTASTEIWCHGALMVVFGTKELGHWVNNAGGGLAAVIQETTSDNSAKYVTAKFDGDMKDGISTKTSELAPAVTGAYGTKHHMTVEVYNGTATIYIDGVDFVSAELPADYSGGYISLAGNKYVGATFDNLVIQKPATNTSLTYSNHFDSLASLSDFNDYYSDNASYTGTAATNGVLTNYGSALQAWSVNNGVLAKCDQSDGGFSNDNEHLISALTYTKDTFLNFSLDVDFTWNDQLWCHGSLMVVFGQNVLGNYVNNTAGGGGLAAVITEQTTNDSDKKVTAGFYGTMKDGISTKTSTQVPLDIGTAYTISHHMTLVVYDDTATIYIDGVKYVSADLPASYGKGYISLAGNKNVNATFDNLEIRRLADTEPEDGTVYKNDFSGTSFSDTLKDFKSYYADDASANSGKLTAEDASNHWELSNGKLTRKDQPGEKWGNYDFVSMLTYTGKTYTNFQLDVDFSWGGTPGRVMVGFGQKELGNYINSSSGGMAFVTDVNLDSYLCGNINGKTDTIAATAKTKLQSVNHLSILVYSGYVTITLNDVEILDQELNKTDAGYISLMMTKVANGSFDNLKIKDLSANNVDPADQRVITGVKTIAPITWNRTDDNSNTLNLPKIVNVTTSAGTTESCRAIWSSKDYKPNMPGTYTYTGKLIMPPSGYVINPNNITASVKVTVKVNYNPATTVKYYFDSLNDLSKFKNYYASDTRVDSLNPTSIEDTYTMQEGCLKRLDKAAGNVSEFEEINSLVYTDRTFVNFRLDVDFAQGGNTWGYPIIAFGIEDPAEYVTALTGGVGAYMTMEGMAAFRGVMADNTRLVTSPSVLAEYPTRAGMHHMTLYVIKRIAVMYVDGTEVLETQLKDDYEGGYISLESNKNMVLLDNLSITTLDYQGNVITLAKSLTLPSTYSNSDPLIGEENDNGKPVAISGVGYNDGLPSGYSNEEENGSSVDTGEKANGAVYGIMIAALSVLGVIYFIKKRKKLTRG